MPSRYFATVRRAMSMPLSRKISSAAGALKAWDAANPAPRSTVAQLADHNLDAVTRSSEAAGQLKNLSGDLSNSVARFRL